MSHPTHKLKAYTGDVRKPLVFCSECGLEDTEASIHLSCTKTFYVGKLDLRIDNPQTKFVSGLPD